MADALDAIGDFVKRIERTLSTRRLYASNTKTYEESNQRIFDFLGIALAEGDFKLRVTATDLFFGTHSVLTCEERSESFFFPLFRDGLRELHFAPGVTEGELECLLHVFEVERSGKLSPTSDTVSMLWRSDLDAISFSAIDGISDDEGDNDELSGSDKDEFRHLISALMDHIKNPAAAETGQSYAIVLDASIKISAADMHYEATTTHQAFEDQKTVIGLRRDEVKSLRTEVEDQDEGELLSRFVEILFVLLNDPARPVSMASLAPIFDRLLQGYWSSQDYSGNIVVLQRLHSAHQEAPNPENRAAASEILNAFLTGELIDTSFEKVVTQEMSSELAFALWSFAGDEIFPRILGFWSTLTIDDLKKTIEGFLRKRLSANPDLLRPSLASEEVMTIRGALALLTQRAERLFEKELLALARHDNEGLRLKGIAAAGRLGGDDASAALWQAMEDDSAKAVRLLAFRLVASAGDAKVAQRIQAIVCGTDFHKRPVWEREKYVKLLASVSPEAAIRIFSTWIPQNKWLWNKKDLDTAQLAFAGMVAVGAAGRDMVESAAASGGKAAKIAQSVLEGSQGQ